MKKNNVENTIVDEVFTLYCGISDDEVNLMNDILNNTDLRSKAELFNITNKVLSLPINKQLYFINCVLNSHFSLTNKSVISDNVMLFLAQKCFNLHREVIMLLVDNDADQTDYTNFTIWQFKIGKLEKKLGIKLIIDDKYIFVDNDVILVDNKNLSNSQLENDIEKLKKFNEKLSNQLPSNHRKTIK